MTTESYHFVGIGGIGMSGLARILLQKKNAVVSGSDLARSGVTESLSAAGAELFYGHSERHIRARQTVVYSSDIRQDNPEYQAALHLHCPMLHRSDLLAKLMEGYRAWLVTGTHGKTTTTALLAWVLIKAARDPSYAIGGIVAGLQANSGYGEGEDFVAEADESDGSFLRYAPNGAIITNIDLDHMTHFGSEMALIDAFHTFARKVKSSEYLFWCGDDVRLKNLKLRGTSYGFNENCSLRASDFRQKGWHTYFDIHFEGKTYREVPLALTGRHNVSNALAVFGLCLRLGVSESQIREAFRTFPGVARRCERKCEAHQVLVIDDYAHHPSEIQVTLRAIRDAIGERRLIAVYQPHRYTRTQDCIGLFGKVFDEADEVIITDIYAAREIPLPNVTHDLVVREIASGSRVPVRYIPRGRLKGHITTVVRPYDVVVMLGAGDVTRLSQEVADHFRQKAPKKLTVGVVCGGISSEHEVTLLSTRQVLPALNRQTYDIKQFGVTKQGKWLREDDVIKKLEAVLCEEPAQEREAPLSGALLKELMSCDVVIPVMHGTYGEDGILQGFLDVLGKAYVGSDHRAGAISMDKAATKRLCQAEGIATAPFIDFTAYEWKTDSERIIREIEGRFPWPVWVKPTHLGSSIEVHRIENREALKNALTRIFQVDTHALAEPEVRGRELEIALLGNQEVIAFPPGEIFAGVRVHDYEGKYSSNGTPSEVVAKLPPGVAEEGMALAKRVYRLAGCSGLARIDFFLDESQKYWVNEINPLPGLTATSLGPKMYRAAGLEMEPLLDRLILLALQRRRELNRLEVRHT